MTELPRNTRRIASGLPPLPAEETVPLDTKRPSVQDTIEAVHRGLALVSYEQFKTIVHATINCGDDYVAACWAVFHGDRLDYCLSRHPEEQGHALVNLALRLGKKSKKPTPDDDGSKPLGSLISPDEKWPAGQRSNELASIDRG